MRNGKYMVLEPERRRIVATSKIFQHGKIVVPKEVREVLGLSDGDKLVWIFEGGRIFVMNAAEKG